MGPADFGQLEFRVHVFGDSQINRQGLTLNYQPNLHVLDVLPV